MMPRKTTHGRLKRPGQAPPHTMAELSDPTINLPGFAPLLADLYAMGFAVAPDPFALEATERPLHVRTSQGPRPARHALLADPAGRRLMVLTLEGWRPPEARELYAHYLSFPLEVRLALTAATHAGADRLLLCSEDRLELYRLSDEQLESRARNHRDLESRLMPVLAGLGKGREATMPLGAQMLPEADALRDWLKQWVLQLGRELELPVESAEQLIWKWILALQFQRRGARLGDFWGLSLEPQDDAWIVGYRGETATDDLIRAARAFDQHVRSFLFDETDEMICTDGLPLADRIWRLEETTLLDRFRAELLMHAQVHFEPETVAWLFTDLNREQRGWQRELSGKPPLESRFQQEAWNVARPLTCEIEQHGLTAALTDAERLARHLASLDELARTRARRSGEPLGRQLDLFRPETRGVDTRGFLADGLNYLFGEALRLRGVAPEARFGVGVTMLLKGMQLAAGLGWPLERIDSVDRLFHPGD